MRFSVGWYLNNSHLQRPQLREHPRHMGHSVFLKLIVFVVLPASDEQGYLSIDVNGEEALEWVTEHLKARVKL